MISAGSGVLLLERGDRGRGGAADSVVRHRANVSWPGRLPSWRRVRAQPVGVAAGLDDVGLEGQAVDHGGGEPGIGEGGAHTPARYLPQAKLISPLAATRRVVAGGWATPSSPALPWRPGHRRLGPGQSEPLEGRRYKPVNRF